MADFSFLRPTHAPSVRLGDVGDAQINIPFDALEQRVSSVSISDQEIEPGGLFAALPGRNGHGARFIHAAARGGATAVLTDAEGAQMAAGCHLPTLVTADPRGALGRVAARVYGTDRVHPQLFGVTGTNGKTTTVHVLEAVLIQLGVTAGHSSTATRRSGHTVVGSRLTSPEAPELHALLARMNEDAVEAAAIEVSAQALTQRRTGGLTFDVAGFTNLSHDHLDEYATMSDYLAAKIALFQPDTARWGVVSLDSTAGHVVAEKANIPVTTITSTPGTTADWTVEVTDATPTSTSFRLRGPNGQQLETQIPLLGRHMAADCGVALVMLTAAGYEFDRLRAALKGGIDVDVPGRTALISGPAGPRVYVDFSHTPDSIEKTLAALRLVARGPVVALLGADGEKDATKRIPMGRAAAEGADAVIVTDHHSRFENPDNIRQALLAGAHSARTKTPVHDIADSSAAIRYAIACAGDAGTVLWVGPGNVDYRIIAGVDVPYSPRKDAAQALREAGWPPSSELELDNTDTKPLPVRQERSVPQLSGG